MKPNVFVIRADYGRYVDAFLSGGYVGIGWLDEFKPEWNLSNKDLLKEKYKSLYPDHPFMRMNQNVGQIFRFTSDIKIGDVILSPYSEHRLIVGTIEGDVVYQADGLNLTLKNLNLEAIGLGSFGDADVVKEAGLLF